MQDTYNKMFFFFFGKTHKTHNNGHKHEIRKWDNPHDKSSFFFCCVLWVPCQNEWAKRTSMSLCCALHHQISVAQYKQLRNTTEQETYWTVVSSQLSSTASSYSSGRSSTSLLRGTCIWQLNKPALRTTVFFRPFIGPSTQMWAITWVALSSVRRTKQTHQQKDAINYLSALPHYRFISAVFPAVHR